MISLIIKGSYDQAINAAMQHDIVIGDLRKYERWGYTMATCDDMHLRAVVKWYASDPNLLLYSQKEQSDVKQ